MKSVIDEYGHALEQVHTSTVRLFYHSIINSKIHRKMRSDIPPVILSQINARFIECNVESLHLYIAKVNLTVQMYHMYNTALKRIS